MFCVPENLFFTLIFCVRNCVWTCVWGFDVVKITVSLSAHTWQLTCCGWHDIPLTLGCYGCLSWFLDFKEVLRIPRRSKGFLLVRVCAWGLETLHHRDDPSPGSHSHLRGKSRNLRDLQHPRVLGDEKISRQNEKDLSGITRKNKGVVLNSIL